MPTPSTRLRRLLTGAVISLVPVACGGTDDGGGPSAVTVDPVATPTRAAAPDTANLATSTTLAAPVATEPIAVEPDAVAEATSEVVEPPETTAAPTETISELVDPLDDLDEDGTFDERCGTADLGGGLTVETLCNTDLQPTPETGVVPTPGSLLLLPSPRWEDLADVDATVRVATAVDGRRIIIYVLGSDTLFDRGSSTVRSTAQPPLAAIVASILNRYPDAPISVRGAADSVGTASANQTLSEQRAAAAADELVTLGIDATRVTSLGLGAAVPVANETNPDGSVSDIGRQVNRRVEIAVG